MGAHYRHTTPEMASRVVMAIQDRLKVVVSAAEQLEQPSEPWVPRNVTPRLRTAFSGKSLANRGSGCSEYATGRPGARPGLTCCFGVEPPAGIEPATPSLPWNHQEPLCETPYPQVTPDRQGQSYRFSCGEVMRSLSIAQNDSWSSLRW